MRRFTALALALALGLTGALGLASCGGEDAKLLPGSTAEEITENLDTVERLANDGDCPGAAGAAEEVAVQVESLQGVDAKLQRALERGVTRLGEVVTTCEATTEAIEPETEATTERTESEAEEKEREKEAKEAEKEAEREAKEAEKEAKEAEKEAEKVEREEESTITPPSEGGGTDAPGGVSPGAPVGADEEGDD